MLEYKVVISRDLQEDSRSVGKLYTSMACLHYSLYVSQSATV